jgi:hypothetical protein
MDLYSSARFKLEDIRVWFDRIQKIQTTLAKFVGFNEIGDINFQRRILLLLLHAKTKRENNKRITACGLPIPMIRSHCCSWSGELRERQRAMTNIEKALLPGQRRKGETRVRSTLGIPSDQWVYLIEGEGFANHR